VLLKIMGDEDEDEGDESISEAVTGCEVPRGDGFEGEFALGESLDELDGVVLRFWPVPAVGFVTLDATGCTEAFAGPLPPTLGAKPLGVRWAVMELRDGAFFISISESALAELVVGSLFCRFRAGCGGSRSISTSESEIISADLIFDDDTGASLHFVGFFVVVVVGADGSLGLPLVPEAFGAGFGFPDFMVDTSRSILSFFFNAGTGCDIDLVIASPPKSLDGKGEWSADIDMEPSVEPMVDKGDLLEPELMLLTRTFPRSSGGYSNSRSFASSGSRMRWKAAFAFETASLRALSSA
jgi:hypothetical protein